MPGPTLKKASGLYVAFLMAWNRAWVQALVVLDVVAHVGQQHQGQEALGHARVQVGHEQPRGLEHRVR